MKKFMDEDFLLESDVAKDLYHNHAAKLPIIDYHCHLDPKMVAEDYHFEASQNFGWVETIISGEPCAPMA